MLYLNFSLIEAADQVEGHPANIAKFVFIATNEIYQAQPLERIAAKM